MDMSNFDLQESVYAKIKDDIMSMRLSPGTAMSTQEVATKLNVSRTPVREAFIRLSRDNLVEILPQRKTLVSKINLQKLGQERFIRVSLECANIKLFIKKHTRKNITDLESLIEQQLAAIKKRDYSTFLNLDNDFHKYMFDASGQSLAYETIESASNQYARIRLVTIWDDETMRKIIFQHQQILCAVQEGDAKNAAECIKDHLSKLESQIKPLMEEHPDYFTSNSFDAESLMQIS